MSTPGELRTPSKSRARNIILQNHLQDSPTLSFYSNLSYDPEENQLTYEDAIKQILQLTNELKEFESSSKELEDAMELELDELSKEKTRLLAKINKRDEELKSQRSRMITMEKELMSLTDKNNELVNSLEQKLSYKSRELINVEIQNDNFESNERIISSKLHTAEENYNDLLEKNVMLQGEINEITKLYNNEKLVNSNKDNMISDLRIQVTKLEEENKRLKVRYSKPEKLSKYKTPLVQTDLRRPPSIQIPKSSSMKQIHEMNAKTNQLSQKADTLRQKIEDLNEQQQQHKKRNRLTKFRSLSANDKENRPPPKKANDCIIC